MRVSYDKALGVIAKGCGLDPQLVRVIVLVESSGNPQALRFEAAFLRRYVKGSKYPPEEHTLLASSWGLMQVMGLTARENGYEGRLENLKIPEVGLMWGCLYLSRLWQRYNHHLEDTIAAYNAGTPRKDPNTGKYFNQPYVSKVLAALQTLAANKKGKMS